MREMKRYQKKVEELELQNKALQKENEELKYNLANISTNSGDSSQKLKEAYIQKLTDLEEQVLELKRKLNTKSQLSSQKPKSDETVKGLQDQISRMKAQKVELQRKIKEESVQFRLSKALLERETLQLKKDARKKEFEMHDLLSSNQGLKKVLQRKVEEASMATKQIKKILGARKARSGAGNGNGPRNQQLMRGAGREREVMVQVHGIHSEYERQKEEAAIMAKKVAELKEEAEILKQRNLRCILQDIEIDCKQKDLEIGNLVQEIKVDCKQKDMDIKNLKEQLIKLNNVVSQLEMQKAELMHREKPQNLTPMIHSVKVAATSEESKSSISTECAGSNTDLSEVINTSEVEKRDGSIGSIVKNISAACCSCSKKSLCKTTKCMCRAAGGSCGASCGCASTKCTNRETILIKLDSPQSEKIDEIKDCSGNYKTEETSILAAHGAKLLQSALVDKPVEMNDNVGTRRKPLSDIKNTLMKSNALKPGRRKKTAKQ